AFHARWYRPDNMTLVLVGDFASGDPLAAVQATFGAIPAPTTPPPEHPSLGAPDLRDQQFALVQPDRVDVSYRVQCTQLSPPRRPTIASCLAALPLGAACEMARWKLVESTKDRNSPVRRVNLYMTTPAHWLGTWAEGVELDFLCGPGQRAEA